MEGQTFYSGSDISQKTTKNTKFVFIFFIFLVKKESPHKENSSHFPLSILHSI